MNQRELEDLRAKVQLEFAKFGSEPFQAELRRRHDEEVLTKRVLKEELPPMPADFNEANAIAWLSEVEVKCPEYWARYLDQKRRESDKQKFGPRESNITATATVTGVRLRRGHVESLRENSQGTGGPFAWGHNRPAIPLDLESIFLRPSRLSLPLRSAFRKCSGLRDYQLDKISVE